MSGTKTLLDTTIIGLILTDADYLKTKINSKGSFGISIITKLEFLSNPLITVKDKFLFENFLTQVQIFEITSNDLLLHTTTISIRKKHKLKLPDAIIAATALVNNATLLSADNIFSKIFNLKFQLIKP